MSDSDLCEQGVRIDCRGVRMDRPVVSVEADGTLFHFITDHSVNRLQTYHAGLFINLEISSEAALLYPRDRRFAALFESPINAAYARLAACRDRYPIIFTHQTDLLNEGDPFRRLLFGTNWVGVRSDRDLESLTVLKDQKHRNVSFIGSIQHQDTGAYSFRREAAEALLKQPDVDCFGKGIREIPGKAEAIAPYRFSVAMENAAGDYYFSEKLIDCLLLETIPVYYGCPGISDLFDQRGFLTFSTVAELLEIVARADAGLYESMRPFAEANRRTAIECGWHTHESLFRRLAAELPAGLISAEPVRPVPARPGVLKRIARRLLRAVSPRA